MMGFLHKLWDETLAGPTPETGLGKLRKYNSFSGGAALRLPMAEEIPISRSITIVRTQSGFRSTTTPDPASPSVPVTPRTPLTSETPGSDFKKLTGRKSLAETVENAENRR
ncbi:dormancy-associated protein homolog 4 isoform X2 [Abrus precatorius]|uniref:Dormancy-associated protein homolog 4 isoform X2 n=1 Tax=Abrus precatorius TaxID=3816 RepID=A0A8B8K3L8_ABRPR|nr:dormancy-associated protein homolog 4 isoform X2 [Abrus precatorius]